MSEARRQIAALIHGLARAIDDADFERIEALVGDGTVTVGSAPPRIGGAAFREAVEQGMRFHDGSPRTAHVITNLDIEVDESGRSARSLAYVTVLQAVPPDFGLQAVMAGRYHDTFRLIDGAWAFESRFLDVVLVGDMSQHSVHRF